MCCRHTWPHPITWRRRFSARISAVYAPHCGKTATVSFHEEFDDLPERGDPDEPGRAPRERLGICPSCGTAGVVPKIDKKVHAADRFIMNRLLQPRRWDLVVFRYPPEPSNIYVMRLIGMP